MSAAETDLDRRSSPSEGAGTVSSPAPGRGRRVLVLGGTSEIAAAIVRELSAGGRCDVLLAGRDTEALESAAAALHRDGCERVQTLTVDALEFDRHAAALSEAFGLLGGVDVVVLAVGLLGERGGIPADIPAALQVLQVNLVGAGSLLLQAARCLREQGHGTLVVLSSVAAERARRTNVVYGASKAGLDTLAQGLGDALRFDGVRVLVVRPGFVDTRMTRGLPRAPLATTPQAVATATVHGIERGAHTVWVPAKLRWIMAILRLLPRPVFRRLPL
jgi:decaprenylphospho-beta-D-erythro-pentofuranosid-2-ulose 2-reductase